MSECAIWKPNGLPRKGWELVDVSDGGDVSEECAWCGTAIRYVHYIKHPEGYESMCGCQCASKLTEDYITGAAREKTLRKIGSRLTKWITSPRWRKSASGNLYRKDKDIMILIYGAGSGWKVKVADTWFDQVFDDRESAKRFTLTYYVENYET